MKPNGPSRKCLRALWPDSGQQTVAHSIRPFKLLSQGLVTAATLSRFLNDCTTRPCDGDNYRAFSNDSHKAVWWKQIGLVQSVTGPCDQNDFATEFAIIRWKQLFRRAQHDIARKTWFCNGFCHNYAKNWFSDERITIFFKKKWFCNKICHNQVKNSF